MTNNNEIVDRFFDVWQAISKHKFVANKLQVTFDILHADGYEVEFERDANGDLTLITPQTRRPMVNPNDNGNLFEYQDPAPKSNDGRDKCYWCGAPTRHVNTGMFSDMRVCTRCGK